MNREWKKRLKKMESAKKKKMQTPKMKLEILDKINKLGHNQNPNK